MDRRLVTEGILDDLHEGLYVLDQERKISYWNPGAERITGFAAEEVVGRPCSANILVHTSREGEFLCRGACPAAATIDDGQTRESHAYLRHKGGHRLLVRIRTVAVYDNGQVVGAAELFTEDTVEQAMKERIRELERMALLDSLTEVGNRRFVEVRLRERLEELRRYGWPFGVLFVDIDHFKAFNDRHGHLMGDRVLRMVACTLVNGVRSFDVVGRWGGEEFVVIVSNSKNGGFSATADRLRALVARSNIAHDERIFQVTVSIGATVATDKDTIESLIGRADELMYESKNRGRNRSSHDLSSEVDGLGDLDDLDRGEVGEDLEMEDAVARPV